MSFLKPLWLQVGQVSLHTGVMCAVSAEPGTPADEWGFPINFDYRAWAKETAGYPWHDDVCPECESYGRTCPGCVKLAIVTAEAKEEVEQQIAGIINHTCSTQPSRRKPLEKGVRNSSLERGWKF